MSTLVPAPPAVRFQGVGKRFGAVQANRGVTFDVAAGSVHGVIGENGAGKSTLMHMLYGSFLPDAGTICIDGEPVRFRGPHDAIRRGVGMVHQHFMQVQSFSAVENILLGAEGAFPIGPAIASARSRIREFCERLGLEIDVDARVSELSVGEMQRVEIVKALYRGARILILDEPTAVLTPSEIDHLTALLQRLRAQGTTVIVISHKLKEIIAMTGRVTVMRGGTVVGERATADTSTKELAELMIGRRVAALDDELDARRRSAVSAPVAEISLEVSNLCWKDSLGVTRVRDVSLQVHAGEILGIAGVSGNGQSELLLLLAGMRRPEAGFIRVLQANGAVRTIDARHAADPHELRRLRVAHVPEDRHRLGIVMGFPAWESAALGYLDDPEIRSGSFIRPAAMRRHCKSLMQRFDVRPADEALMTDHFSGGNQQKLVLAREHHRQPKVLLIGQPTRGVDIGAIESIYGRLRELRDQGCAVLLVSSELDELLALSDRIACMCGGRITGTLACASASREVLGALMGDGAGPMASTLVAA